MSRLAVFRIALWSMVVLCACALLAVTFLRSEDRLVGEAPYGIPFKLENQNGQPVTEALFKGQPSAVFFGFTHCPEVCPTTLSELGAYRQDLKKEGKVFNIVFVTVDPERDTPELLKTYVSGIGQDVTALTGKPDDVAAMLKGWGVYRKKVGEGADYTMDHTATTFLLDSKGRLVGTLAFDEDAASAKAKLERLAAS